MTYILCGGLERSDFNEKQLQALRKWFVRTRVRLCVVGPTLCMALYERLLQRRRLNSQDMNNTHLTQKDARVRARTPRARLFSVSRGAWADQLIVGAGREA